MSNWYQVCVAGDHVTLTAPLGRGCLITAVNGTPVYIRVPPGETVQIPIVSVRFDAAGRAMATEIKWVES